MSILKVDGIRHNSATSDAITTHSDGTASAKLIDVGGGPLSHRNYFINGNTIIWQRGTSNPNVNNYGCDRWWFANNATRVDRSTTVPDGFAYSMKVTSSGGTTSIGQPIELIDTGRSQFEPNASYTLSFYARTDSGTNDISGTVYYRNSKFSTTNQVNWSPVSQNMGTMTTTFQRFSKTFTAPAAPNVNNTMVAIEFNNTATYYITGIQFERGDTMTAYEHRSTSEELARCQRYCVVYGGSGARHLGTASAYNSTHINLSIHLPVPMRASPSASTVTSGGNWLQSYMGASGNNSNASISVADMDQNHHTIRLYLQNAHSGLSAGQALWIHTLPNAKLILSAEL